MAPSAQEGYGVGIVFCCILKGGIDVLVRIDRRSAVNTPKAITLSDRTFHRLGNVSTEAMPICSHCDSIYMTYWLLVPSGYAAPLIVPELGAQYVGQGPHVVFSA